MGFQLPTSTPDPWISEPSTVSFNWVVQHSDLITTWRIIPVGKWLITLTMISCCHPSRVVPLPNALMVCKRGLLTTSKNDPVAMENASDQSCCTPDRFGIGDPLDSNT